MKKKLSTKTLNYIGVAYCLSCSNPFGDVNDLTVSFWQFIWHFFWDLQSGTIKLLPLHEIPSGTEKAMGAMFCLNCLKTYQTEKGQKEYSDKLEKLSAKFWISMASFNLLNGHWIGCEATVSSRTALIPALGLEMKDWSWFYNFIHYTEMKLIINF